MTDIALPAKYTLTCWAGATFRKTITLLSGDTGSSPRNLTGYTASMAIRPEADQTPLLTLTTGNGGITLGGAQGTVALYISSTTTLTFDTWASRAAVYDLTITDTGGSGDTEALLWGVFRVTGVA